MTVCKEEGCKNRVWSKGRCKIHLPKLPNEIDNKEKQNDFFRKIWKKRKHNSEISGEWLGPTPKSYMFHHILPKSKYPQAAFDEETIILVTFVEHSQVESNIFRYPIVNEKRKKLITKYNL